MSKTIAQAIEEIQAQIHELEDKARPLKAQVNTLCEIDGIAHIYPDVNQSGPTAAKPKGLKLRVDEFAADKLGRAVRRYLELRAAADPDNRAARIEDIKAALVEGGFDFKGKDPINALSISLGKSSHTFKRLNEGHFGLAEWYGQTRPKTRSTSAATPSADDLDKDDETAEVESESDAKDETTP